jgi:hypothetical protein
MSRFAYNVIRLVGVALTLLGLTGCWSLDAGNMVVQSSSSNGKLSNQLLQAMCVRSVGGGETGGLPGSLLLSDKDFENALSGSLSAAGLLASTESCKYPIYVNLLGILQTGAVTREVTSHINYKIYDPTNRPILLETISARYMVGAFEVLDGAKRTKLANEGSIRSNIAQFLEKLQAVGPR